MKTGSSEPWLSLPTEVGLWKCFGSKEGKIPQTWPFFFFVFFPKGLNSHRTITVCGCILTSPPKNVCACVYSGHMLMKWKRKANLHILSGTSLVNFTLAWWNHCHGIFIIFVWCSINRSLIYLVFKGEVHLLFRGNFI